MSQKEFIVESVQILKSLTLEQYEEVKAFMLIHCRGVYHVSKIIFKIAEECRPKLLEMK